MYINDSNTLAQHICTIKASHHRADSRNKERTVCASVQNIAHVQKVVEIVAEAMCRAL